MLGAKLWLEMDIIVDDQTVLRDPDSGSYATWALLGVTSKRNWVTCRSAGDGTEIIVVSVFGTNRTNDPPT